MVRRNVRKNSDLIANQRIPASLSRIPKQRVDFYDASGNLSQFTDRRGKVTTCTYRGLGRRTFAGFGTATGTPPSYESSISYTHKNWQRCSRSWRAELIYYIPLRPQPGKASPSRKPDSEIYV